MDRRTFIGTITAATLVSSRLNWAAAAEHKIDKVGVQLYTVRDDMQRDFEGTIARVAKIGYREVEFAGLFDHSPKDVKAMLDRNGLTAPSSHIPYKALGADWPKTLEGAQVLGQKYIVCPMIDEDVRNAPDGWKRAAEAFNRAGEASQKAGIQFAYHNHNFEFVPTPGGKLAYDVLLDETDPKLVQMELDLCWISVAGQDPVKYFHRYPGRFPLVHVKDVKEIPQAKGGQPVPLDYVVSTDMTEVGSGVIDWKRIFADGNEAGLKHYFVEHDKPKAPFESIQKSFAYLHTLRF
jgi:sugar phosphate isomerase/epimerase